MRQMFVILSLLCSVVFLAPGTLTGQQQAAPQRSAPATEEMTAEAFTALLKQIWGFLQTETQAYRDHIDRKDEFETTEQYEQRRLDRRRQYLANVVKYSRNENLPARSFWIPFKASLLTYDADAQVYQVASSGLVQAPYNIPLLETTVAPNQYLALADSISRGYRTSTLYLKFKPSFAWKIAPAEARAAKEDPESLGFRVRVAIDIESMEGRDRARLRIVPREVQLIDTKTLKIFWQESL